VDKEGTGERNDSLDIGIFVLEGKLKRCKGEQTTRSKHPGKQGCTQKHVLWMEGEEGEQTHRLLEGVQ